MNVKSEPLVSVIIPVYNADKTLRVTLNSLLKQTYRHLQIVLINDCSTDGSDAIMEEFFKLLTARNGVFVKIIKHEANSGVAAARNSGLKEATGEYVYFVDADDWLDADAIELMVERARMTGADIVGFNWWLSFAQSERQMNQPAFSDAWEAVKWMLIGRMRWNLWIFLVRRSLYTEHLICFTPGMNMGEDMVVVLKLFICAESVSFLDKALYHYGRSNDESLTRVYSEQHIKEVTYNVKEVESFLLNSKFASDSVSLIDYLKLNIKLPLLISNKKSQYDRWRLWFPETNAAVADNSDVSARIRVLQWAAANKRDWIIKLHYYLVIRLVYGIIYK